MTNNFHCFVYFVLFVICVCEREKDRETEAESMRATVPENTFQDLGLLILSPRPSSNS